MRCIYSPGRLISYFADAAPSVPIVGQGPNVAPQNFVLGNVALNAAFFLSGILAGSVLVYLGRKFIRKYSWDGYPTLLVAIDGVLVTVGSLITSATNILKADSWKAFDKYMASGFVVMGVILAAGVGSKILMVIARNANDKRSTDLRKEITDLTKQRDAALDAETLLCEVMKAKLNRLAAWRRQNGGSLVEALDPESHIHVLLTVLHGYFAKFSEAAKRVRIGIYMLAEDEKTLEAVYAWDGTGTDCFSNRHAAMMKLTSPGGSRSLVVEAWLGSEPFRCVPDTEAAARAGTFNFFHPEQSKELCSMVAYRHNMTILDEGAFILTLDSNQRGFFSGEVEAKCRLLLPAFSKRIELEQLSLPVD